jgi:general secretion pathway protein B
MSFILDALKKSETDRQRQTAPALFEVKVAAPRRRLPAWAIALGVLLGVNLLVVAWLFSRQSSPAAQPASAAVSGAQTQAEPAAPPGMVTVPATATYIPANAAPNVTVGPGNHDAGVVAPSIAPPLAEEPQLASGEPSVPPDYDARDYTPAITPAQASATAAARRAGGALPSRDEVLAQGTQLPDLRLDLHVYDPDPAKRFVFLNMRKLREGESLPDGVRVDSITQTGAHLTYRGTQFTIDAN